MIGRITGILLEKQAPHLLVDVNGVGYELQAPMSTFYQLPEIGQKVSLHTHFVVREDGQFLYGFYKNDERALFRMLIKTSGVGPRLALTILSGIEPELFMQCVASEDVVSLVRLPGIGKKTAERLLLEMRDRLKDWHLHEGFAVVAVSTVAQDAISALVALGYRPQDASRAIAKFKDQQLSSEEMIRQALRELAG